nr:phd finger protein [Ipomoea batatas]
MESAVEVRSGDKRPPDDGEIEGQPAGKKVKGFVGGNVKKVAEMVLVLAAMGKMRGGRSPTDAEKEMMAEARDKLAEVCQVFAPKDVFPRDAFGGVIEDLGLNKLKEQRLGFRPPKTSIAEKMLLSKRKMEKPEDFTLQSAPYSSQRLQSNSGTTVENRAPPHGVRMFQADKPGQAPISSGNFQSASTLGHGSIANSASLPYQLPTSEIRPVTHAGLTTASSGDHSTLRPPNWSMTPPSHSAAKVGPENGVPAHSTTKVEGGPEYKSGMAHQVTTSRPFINQTSSGNFTTLHQQGITFVSAPPPSNTHAEVGKIVQRFLQPQLPDRPVWTPPSRDYMSKALTCQMCKFTVTEVENVLVCDACEKGYHLKCLQINNQKGVPRGEWHCGKCLSLTNGKPLPPKYGRVMRNINATKVSSTAPMVQPSLDKKVSQKVIVNGNVALQNPPTVGIANRVNPASFPKVENSKDMLGNDTMSSNKSTDSKVSSESCPNSLMKASGDSSVSPVGSSVDKPCQGEAVELKQQPPAKTESTRNSSDHSHPSVDCPSIDHIRLSNSIEISSKQSPGNNLEVVDLKESCDRATSSNDVAKKGEQGAGEVNTANDSTAYNGNTKCSSSSSDRLHIVGWVGSKHSVGDEKIFYNACRINGYVYNLEDYALIRFGNDRLIPSKLQTMWEDTKTGMKWVTVNRCYFARDLPASVGRPCSLESSEVYLSNFGSAVMAGLIEGPCEVLPPSKFTEERERRTRAVTEKNDLRPLYLCKWIFDEAKGLFRDVSC